MKTNKLRSKLQCWVLSLLTFCSIGCISANAISETLNVHGSGGSYNGHRERYRLNYTITNTGGLAADTYYIHFGSGGSHTWPYLIITVNSSGTVTSGGSGTLIGAGTAFDPVVSMPYASGTSFTWEGAEHLDKAGVPNFGFCSSEGATVTRIDSYTDGDTTDTVTEESIVITIGGSDPCPPHTGVDFELGLTLTPGTGTFVRGLFVVTLVVDGATLDTAPIDLRNNETQGNVAVSMLSGPFDLDGEFSGSWKVNGVTVASFEANCGDEVPEIVRTATCSVQGGTGTDTDTTTDDDGNTTTTTTEHTPGGTDPTTPGTTTTTTTTTMDDGSETDFTKQDLYEAVKQGAIDAGRTGTTADGYGFGLGDAPEHLGSDIDSARLDYKAGRDTALGAIGALIPDFEGMPTSFGSPPSTLVIARIGTTDFTVNFNTTAANNMASLIRAAILFVMSVGFIITTISTVRRYV